MNLKTTGLNFNVTATIRSHVIEKLERISHHASDVTSVVTTLSVEKVSHKAEADIHLAGKDPHVEVAEIDMYIAVDVLMDKTDRAVLKYKEKSSDVRNTVKPAAK